MKNTNVIVVVAALVIIAVVGYLAIDKSRQASEAQMEIARLNAEVERLRGEKEKIEKAKVAGIPCSTAKLIVPWKAGGGTHVIFSIFEKTIQNLDVTPKVKVVTISGQGGNKGAKEAAKAAFLNSSKVFQGTVPLAPTMSGVEVKRETVSKFSKWKSMRPFR